MYINIINIVIDIIYRISKENNLCDLTYIEYILGRNLFSNIIHTIVSYIDFSRLVHADFLNN